MADEHAVLRKKIEIHAKQRQQYTARANAATEALRDLAVQAVAAGMPKTRVAEVAQISRPTLDAWLQD